MAAPLVLKLGGELLEQPADLAHVASVAARLSESGPLVVVHGGGREIDAALRTAGIEKVQVDGLRVTDARTLEVVTAVLAGTLNTRLVAAVRRAGARAVGLSGVDASVVTVRRARPMRSTAGATVDLGLVGVPVSSGRPTLLADLLARRYVPVVACLGVTASGQVLNVNADTLAAHLAAALRARRLVIAGGTAGVLDEREQTIASMRSRDASALIRSGTANRGMIAKLQACQAALRGGVADVLIVNGRTVTTGALRASGPAAGHTQVRP